MHEKMCHPFECVCHGRFHKMQDGDADGDARGIDDKEHPQLMQEVP